MMFHAKRDYCYIAIDWGLPCLDAYLCCMQPHQNVEIRDELHFDNVIVDQQNFSANFLQITEKWREEYGRLPIILSGNIEQTDCWTLPLPRHCPLTPADLFVAQSGFEYEGHSIYVLPSLNCQHNNGHADVMWGQHVQVLGWLDASASHRNGKFLICLPGKQSKWILVKDGIIEVFKTAVSGEVFESLSTNSFVSPAATDAIDDRAFDLGSNFALGNHANKLISALYTDSAETLSHHFEPVDDQSYLRGVLIGSEVRGAMLAKEWRLEQINEVIIIGECQVTDLFERVIRTQTKSVRCFHGKQATVLGFASIRQRHLSLNS